MGRAIGIDLGTTQSVVAVLDGARPRVLESAEGTREVPSAVSVRKRRKASGRPELLVGRPALDNQGVRPKDTIVAVKRLMGRGVNDPEVKKLRRAVAFEVVEPADGTRDSVRVVLDGRQYSPVDISAKVLEKLKADAELRLNDTVTHAVITVPAYFSLIQRDATRRAAWQAGLKVIKVIDEPTAAAIAFGMDDRGAGDNDAKTLLIYDLGGGTFDVSVLVAAGASFAPMALMGDMWLGGVDFDRVVLDRILDHVQDEHDVSREDALADRKAAVRLEQAARQAKEALSSQREADVLVAGALTSEDGDLLDVDCVITREQFEADIRPLCDHADDLVDQALASAGLVVSDRDTGQERPNYDDVDAVIMVGNSSRIPEVQRRMERKFGKTKVLNTIEPKLSVAMGAAIVAARVGNRLICHAPIKDTAGQVCGHVNDDGATACAACGAPLGFASAGALPDGQPLSAEKGAGAAGTDTLVIGGIAPFHYGAQSAGDRFNLYVKKGDQYPTAEPKTQTFYTQQPNERTVRIPVYGGETLERASANEKQGEAFAALPQGLPRNTPIRITLALDGDGVYTVTAELDDGTKLRPRMLHGEADARAVDALVDVEQRARAEHVDVGGRIDEAFDRFEQDDYAGAEKVRGEIEDLLDREAQSRQEQVDTTTGAVAFLEHVKAAYRWALQPKHVGAIDACIAWIKAGCAGSLEVMGRTHRPGSEADAVFKVLVPALPNFVGALLGLEAAIVSIAESDPAAHEGFLTRFRDAVLRLQRGDETALEDLRQLQEDVEGTGASVAGAAGTWTCSRGHTAPQGRPCPICGERPGILRHAVDTGEIPKEL
ncbi:MAG: Hsp70 family protein [Acidobacteria bacterium]|nr:Hsp70 family protein [Acidobacteriota bacterium]